MTRFCVFALLVCPSHAASFVFVLQGGVVLVFFALRGLRSEAAERCWHGGIGVTAFPARNVI